MHNRQRANVFARARQRWVECVLVTLVLSACLLSGVWIFRVPLLQNPDETSHIDYVFSIYTAGRLLNVRRAPSGWNVHPRFGGRNDKSGPESQPYDLLSHQYTLYLVDATDFQRIRFHSEQKVDAEYGTLEYYQKLEANAPQSPASIGDLQPQDNPWMVTAYPFLYYAVVAMVQRLVSLFEPNPIWLFFAARLLSLIFFAGSLILVYCTLRELRVKKQRALVLTAIVAFFPLITFVSSSVQPDNLAMLLVLCCWYFVLLIRRSELNAPKLYILLGISLGALLVTKYHIYLVTTLAVFATLISEQIFRRGSVRRLIPQLLSLLVPSLFLFGMQLWIVWGGGRITGSNLHPGHVGLTAGIKNALRDYYRGGPAWISWWGTFGWMDAPLTIWSPSFQARVSFILLLLTLLVLILVLFRLEQIVTRLVVLARHRRGRMALRLAFANPLVTSHFLFSIFMILLYAFTDNTFFAQGRHWVPYTLSGFLITTEVAPRALTHRSVQRAVSYLLILGLLGYCAMGEYFSLKTITTRYYPVISSPTDN